MPRRRVNGSCAFWKKLVLVRNTFPSVPHPLNLKPLPPAAGAGTKEFGAAVKNKGGGVFSSLGWTKETSLNLSPSFENEMHSSLARGGKAPKEKPVWLLRDEG